MGNKPKQDNSQPPPENDSPDPVDNDRELLASQLTRRLLPTMSWYSMRHREATIASLPDEVRKEIRTSVESLTGTKPRGMLLFGNPDSGKTWALYAAAHRICMNLMKALPDDDFFPAVSMIGEVPVMVAGGGLVGVDRVITKAVLRLHQIGFYTYGQLMTTLRMIDRGGEGWNEAMDNYPLGKEVVFIDDIGSGETTDKELGRLSEYIDWRWRMMKPLYLSTNFNPDLIREIPGWERIFSRICDPNFTSCYVMEDQKYRKKEKDIVRSYLDLWREVRTVKPVLSTHVKRI